MEEFAKQTEVDLAYQVLRENCKVLYFRDLINKVFAIQKESLHATTQSMSQVHTQINMDSRFVHMGKGMWGLTEWLPQHRANHYSEEMAAASEDFEDGQSRQGR